jgi:hypothetical protein
VHASLTGALHGTQVELVKAMRNLMFDTATEAMMGPAFLRRHGASAVRDAFFEFEAAFEVGNLQRCLRRAFHGGCVRTVVSVSG